MKWTESYTVNAHDTDINDIVSLTGIMRYIQDCAHCQMAGEGPSYDKLHSQGKAFVISRLAVSIYGKLYAHDKIKASTWACDSTGVSFNRCYSVERDGKKIAEASSIWALLDTVSGRLIRVSDFPNNYCVDEPLELDMPSHFRLPADVPLALVGERTVEYQDVDINGHMNNTRYGDILCGYLPDMRGLRVIKFSINYCGEARLGESLKVYMGRSGDGAYVFRTVREGGKTNIEAEILTEKL